MLVSPLASSTADEDGMESRFDKRGSTDGTKDEIVPTVSGILRVMALKQAEHVHRRVSTSVCSETLAYEQMG
jgi:hypothetical protein